MMQVDQEFQADFCPNCGALIQLQTIGEAIQCYLCHTHRPFKDFTGKVMKTQLTIKKDKDWLLKYEGRQVRQRRGKTKMVIKQRCPKCDHPQLKYYTVQTRSVDEGSTVFYECQKCSHTFSINN